MKDNIKLQKDIMEELRWEPRIDAAAIGVAVHGNIVTLTGHVPTYLQKEHAERAVRRLSLVHGIANELEVRPISRFVRDDEQIARAAVTAMEWRADVPEEKIKTVVNDGWVRLEGQVDWNFEREAAAKAVRKLKGVKGVINNVTIKPKVSAEDVKTKIEAALKRAADIESDHIEVAASGSTVTLKGEVRSWTEKMRVQDAAWAAPGVTEVVSKLTVNPYIYA